jgi:hypothetical protein
MYGQSGVAWVDTHIKEGDLLKFALCMLILPCLCILITMQLL